MPFISFNITGEYITELVRNQLYKEGKDIEVIIRLLRSCMEGTSDSEATLRRYAEDILIGRAALKGSTADNTYHLELYNPEEQPEMPEDMNIFKVLARNIKKLKETEEKLQTMREYYAVAMDYVPEYQKNRVLEETGQPIVSRYGNAMLDSFMQRNTDEETHTTEDYGWLEPNGTFHAVEWGDHQEFASNWIHEHLTEDELLDEKSLYPGDYLADKGWVLLHNPAQGIAEPTKNPDKPYTKAQKKFLYDYYMERQCEMKALEVWEE